MVRDWIIFMLLTPERQKSPGFTSLTGHTLFESLSDVTWPYLCWSGNISDLLLSGFLHPHMLQMAGQYPVLSQGNSQPDFCLPGRLWFYNPYNRCRLARGIPAHGGNVQPRARHPFYPHSGIFVCVVRYISLLVLDNCPSYQYAPGHWWMVFLFSVWD